MTNPSLTNSSHIAVAAFGYLQTVCPVHKTPDELNQHLATIQANLTALMESPRVHYVTVTEPVAPYLPTLTRLPDHEHVVYHFPMSVYMTSLETYSEIPLPHGRFFAVSFKEYVNPFITATLNLYSDVLGGLR